MATENAPKTFSDLYGALLARLRQDSGNSIQLAQAKQHINLALMNMHMGFGEKFPWAERSATLITQAKYTTGTVSVSVGSTSLTGVSSLWNTSNSYGVANARAGGKLVLAGAPDVYEVASVGSDTAITLATRYVASAALSAETYTYFEDEYDLATDFLKPVDLQSFDTDRQIPLISRTDFRRMAPRSNVTGKIRYACIQDRAPSGNVTPRRRVRFYMPPDTTVLIPYAYVTKHLVVSSAGTAQEEFSADTDEPIVPRIYRHAIVLKAKAEWYLDKKDDPERAERSEAEYNTFMLRVLADGDIGEPRMRIEPRVGSYRRAAARPWSGGSGGRYDLNGKFDRLER
ncbi:MAG: hypothetical protein WA210_14355 [Burkholderiaceae bacterium]